MRLLFLGLNYAPEEIGIGLYSGDMVRSWAVSGHKVRAIVAKPYYPTWQIFEEYRHAGWQMSTEYGVDVIRCPIYVPTNPSGFRRILHHFSFMASALAPMLKAAWSTKPDLIFTTAPSLIAAPIAWLCGRITNSTTWIHIQDLEVEAAFATGLMSRNGWAAWIAAKAESWIIKRFDVVSTISPQMCTKLIEKGVDPRRISEFRNWTDVDAVKPLNGPSAYRSEWNIKTPHVALYSGNIANKQGIEIIVEAAVKLRERSDLTFVICGQGQNRARLTQIAAELGNVQLHDLQPRERLGELLGLATVHLLPQLAGAADLVLPSKLTNMLASGRPIIATAEAQTGLANEVAGCGVVTPPGDVNSFAQAIIELLDDAAARASLGIAARHRAEKRWSKQAILHRLDRDLEAARHLAERAAF